MSRVPPRRRRRGAVAVAVGALLAVLAALLLGTAGPASAHANLVGTDPVEGAVLDAAPQRIGFTFDEAVGSVPDRGVQVFDARGEVVASSATVDGAQLDVSLEGPVGEGTLVVTWRVVSSDGHPIGGALTFSVGQPSASVVPAALDAGEPAPAPAWLSLTRWVGYVALLLCAGLVAFAVLCLGAGAGSDAARRRVVRTARGGAAVAAVAWVLALPLTGSYQRGTGALPSFGSESWSTLATAEYAVAAAVVLGVGAAVVLLGDGRPRAGAGPGALAAAAAASAAPALTGHTRAATPQVLAVGADALHLVAGGVWLGGLVGLALVLPALSGAGGTRGSRGVGGAASTTGTEVLARFSGLAAGVLAALVAAGAVLTWRIVGSWSGLVDTTYGRLLLLKVAIAAVAVLVAAWNRYALLPRVRRSARAADRQGGRRLLARSTAAEAAVLAGAVLVTGFLVDTSPEGAPAAAATVTATGAAGGAAGGGADGEVRSTLGDVVVVGAISPRAPGRTTVTVRLEHTGGGPAEGVQSLTARLSSDALDLGEVPLAFVGPGSYAGEVVLPAPGTWRLQVSVRRSEFVNPVTTLELEVPAG